MLLPLICSFPELIYYNDIMQEIGEPSTISNDAHSLFLRKFVWSNINIIVGFLVPSL
jgi:hypothetical protein